MDCNIRNPKRDLMSKQGKAGWYNYYASYSPGFVEDVLGSFHLSDSSIIMDPWNGSGITTQTANKMGYESIGFDINPVMVIVAKAKNLNHNVSTSIHSICIDIIKKAKSYRIYPWVEDEPLETWLTPNSAKIIRNIERAIQELLISDKRYYAIYLEQDLDFISSLAAFYYVALFRTLRDILSIFYASNPTWIKKPKEPNERIDLNCNNTIEVFKNHVEEMINGLCNYSEHTNINSLLQRSSSDSLPVQDESIHAVITSPPYCTRIDYAIATRLELALLGYSAGAEFTTLRRNMIGSPMVNPICPEINSNWGKTATSLLERINKHPSKASKTYYYKNYLQYFMLIFRSLEEIGRTVVKNGDIALVLQDSYYKEIHVDLPVIYSEMGDSLSWTVKAMLDYPKRRTMAGVNNKVVRYRKDTSAMETVLIFKK